jgi:uncharacterized protein YkwD
MENKNRLYQMALLFSLALNLVLIFVAINFFRQADNTPSAAATNQRAGATEISAVATATPPPTITNAAAEPTSEPTRLTLPTATATLVPEPSQTPTPVPTAAEPQPAPTEIPPTETPTAVPPTPTAIVSSAEPTLMPGPTWLQYTNLFRIQARLPQLVENTAYSAASQHHSRYMIETMTITHSEDSSSPFFSQAGHEAALNGNLAVGGWDGASDIWPIEYWMSATFHALPILNPRLSEAGYGTYRDTDSDFKLTGTMHLSTKQELGAVPDTVTFPIMFPEDGGGTWIHKYTLPEFPDPLSACPGYQRPTGPPIILQLGDGSLRPNVNASFFRVRNEDLPHCVLHESNYINSTSYFQETGRQILDQQDAIVIIPQQPLQQGLTYWVTIVVGNETYEWSFEATAKPGGY